MPYVNFSEIKARVSMEQVIDLLDLKVKKEGDQRRAACPACKAGDRTLSMNVKMNLFQCFASHQGGDVIALVAHVRGLSQRDAAVLIDQQFPNSSRGEGRRESSPPSEDDGGSPPNSFEERIADLEERVRILEEGKVVRLSRGR